MSTQLISFACTRSSPCCYFSCLIATFQPWPHSSDSLLLIVSPHSPVPLSHHAQTRGVVSLTLRPSIFVPALCLGLISRRRSKTGVLTLDLT